VDVLVFKFNKKSATIANVLRSLKKLAFALVVFLTIHLYFSSINTYVLITGYVLFVFWMFFEVERFFNHMSNIKHQELEITETEMITKNLKKGTSSVVKKNQFELGKVKMKNDEIFSIGIRYSHAPCDLDFKYYDDMDELLLCLKRIKGDISRDRHHKEE
jgi:hypothetical protein